MPTQTDLNGAVGGFLDQLVQTSLLASTPVPYAGSAIGDAAAVHGRSLRAQGSTLAEVVHEYGDICQAVTEIAIEQHADVSVEDFHLLNRSLDTAIAEAVTAHATRTSEQRSAEEVERLGQVSHEIRDFVNTALVAFRILQEGSVPVKGSTAAVLGRALLNLRDFINSTLSDVRLAANLHRRERMSTASFLGDLVAASSLRADYQGLRFTAILAGDDPIISVDPQLLGSAVTNLLNNAFKYSRKGGAVALTSKRDGDKLVIAIRDECGGIPAHVGDPFKPFGERRGKDRTGLGLGLSIARQAVRAHGGDIHVDNLPGEGCVFSIEVPLADADGAVVSVAG